MAPGPKGSSFTPKKGGPMITIKLANQAKVLGRFKQHAAGVVIAGQVIAKGVAEEIAEVARDLVPVESGKTKESIRVESEHPDGDFVVVVDRFGDKPEVPIYLEIGTFKMAARPFLKPASDLVMASGGLLKQSTQIGGLLSPKTSLGFGR
jgi:hypothetical protein